MGFGPQLVINGTFEINTDNWTADNSILSVVSQRLQIDATGANATANQNIVLTNNKRYKLSVDVFDIDTDAIKIQVWNNAFSVTLVNEQNAPDGTNKFFFTTSETSQHHLQLKATNVSGKKAQFDNVSLREVISIGSFGLGLDLSLKI